MQVRDFIEHKVYTVMPTTAVKELLSIFEKNRIGGVVPVVDFKGTLLGIIMDGDIVRFLSPNTEKVYLFYYMTYMNEVEPIENVLRKKMNTPIIKIMVKKILKPYLLMIVLKALYG